MLCQRWRLILGDSGGESVDDSLMKAFIICLVGLCIQGIESGPSLRMRWQSQAFWTRGLHPSLSAGELGRPVSSVSADGQEHPTSARETPARDMVEHSKGFTRRKHIKKSLEVHFGRFNSDMVSISDQCTPQESVSIKHSYIRKMHLQTVMLGYKNHRTTS